MADTRFWRTLAVTFVAGVFYLAHGLHDSGSINSLPNLTQELQAGDVSIISHQNRSNVKIVTTSDEGHTLYVWSTTTGGDIPKYVGSVVAK